MIFEDFFIVFWSLEVAQHIFTMFLGLICAVESIYGGFGAIRNLLRKLRTISVLKINNFPKCVNFSQRRVRINPAYDCSPVNTDKNIVIRFLDYGYLELDGVLVY